MPGQYARRLRDPIYSYIYIPEALIPLVESAQVRRLRRVTQNAGAQSIYPSLNGSRFEHSLGTMHLALRAWDNAWGNVQGQKGSTDIQVKTQLTTEVWNYVNSSEADQIPDPYWDQLKRSPHFDNQTFQRVFSHEMRNCIGAVGLLHDVGHAPFSHTLESVFSAHKKKAFHRTTLDALDEIDKQHGDNLSFHELCGWKIVRDMIDQLHLFERISTRIFWAIYSANEYAADSPSWAVALRNLLSDQVDVDRIDYIVRDSRRAGTEFGSVDIERLLNSVELHWRPDNHSAPWAVGYSSSGVSAVESLLENRERSYRWIYHHPGSIIADTALARICELLLQTQKDFIEGLDYVGGWVPLDGDVLPKSYFADDLAVMNFLRSELPSHQSDGKVRHLRSLVRIADGYERQYVAAWRNYEEFKFATSLLGSEDLQSILESFSEGFPASVRSRARDANEERIMMAINQITDSKGEGFLEELLNSQYPRIEGVDGTWLVAKRTGFRSGKASRFALFRQGREISFSRVSASAVGLVEADFMRVLVWGFFLPDDPQEDLSEVEKQVSSIFIHALTDITKGSEDE